MCLHYMCDELPNKAIWTIVCKSGQMRKISTSSWFYSSSQKDFFIYFFIFLFRIFDKKKVPEKPHNACKLYFVPDLYGFVY